MQRNFKFILINFKLYVCQYVMSFEQSTNSKKFTQQVNSLIEKGVVGSFAEIAEAIGYDRTSITNVMKGRRNVPIRVYRRFTEVYKLNKPVNGSTVNEPIEPYNDYKDRYINSLESQIGLLKDQVSLATGELRHTQYKPYLGIIR